MTLVLESVETRLIKSMKEALLIQKGWSLWYHHDYWVHPKTIVDPTRQDHTNYGMSLDKAYEYETQGGKPYPPLLADLFAIVNSTLPDVKET